MGRKLHVGLQRTARARQRALQTLPDPVHRGGFHLRLRNGHRQRGPALALGVVLSAAGDLRQPATKDRLAGFGIGRFKLLVEHGPGPGVLQAAELHAEAQLPAKLLGFRLDVSRQMPVQAPAGHQQRRRHAQRQKSGDAQPAAGCIVKLEHPCSPETKPMETHAKAEDKRISIIVSRPSSCALRLCTFA